MLDRTGWLEGEMAGYVQGNQAMVPLGIMGNMDTSRESQPFSDTESSNADNSEGIVDSLSTSSRETSHNWQWSNEHRDFISHGPSGEVVGYKAFQMSGRDSDGGRILSASASTLPHQGVQGTRSEPGVPRPIVGPTPTRPMPLRAFEQPLDSKFTYVEKPKRFFSIGRIFKTAWFEPSGQDPILLPPSSPAASTGTSDYTALCPAFYGEKPFAKFRWFVVVRKRLHHSLCFSITTFGGKGGASKTSRGRPQDFLVLHAASSPAPAPDPEEKIVRDPIGVIIEDGEQFISPLARLDCGRIYTVEDNLKVMKVGRVHPGNLQMLEQYFKESVS